MEWVPKIPWRSLGRWWIVGLAFSAGGLGLMYLLITVLRLPLLAGTTLSGEFTIVLRFLINDRWVFGHPRPTWTRLWQFHVASAGGAAIWWVVANTLPRFGVYYLIASLAGTACSVVFSMCTNFLWIWRDRKRTVDNPAAPPPLRRAVFLDRDGVINTPVVRDGRPYPPSTIEEFSIYPEAAPACDLLKSAGFTLIVATNQPDVGRGTQRLDVVEQMHARMLAALPLDRVEVCYDPTPEGSSCYKPAPGMLFRAAAELRLDLSRSYMIGDRWRDVDCGHAARCTTIFIDRGYREDLRLQPHFRVSCLMEAAEIVLRDCEGS